MADAKYNPPPKKKPSTRKHNRAYTTWLGMRLRCRPHSQGGHLRYGARGISVCDRWGSFANFFEDMGDPPVGMSIDRIDNDGDYEPGNCRWATQREQTLNTCRTRFLTAFGKTQPAALWGDETGIPLSTVHRRLAMGWTPEEALTPERRKRKRRPREPRGKHNPVEARYPFVRREQDWMDRWALGLYGNDEHGRKLGLDEPECDVCTLGPETE